MSDFAVKGEDLKATAQALLEGRKMARSLENLAESLLPLANDKEATESLQAIIEGSRQISAIISTIYSRNAREAFSDEPRRPVRADPSPQS